MSLVWVVSPIEKSWLSTFSRIGVHLRYANHGEVRDLRITLIPAIGQSLRVIMFCDLQDLC